MPKQIKIIIGDLSLKAELFDTETAKKIHKLLPLESMINTWGDEFYFEIPLNMPLDETATTDVNIGDIGYWPPGNALAIFFGPTPISNDDKPVPASEVNLVGRIIDDARVLKGYKKESKIFIKAL
ncbi:MAG: hypothetical protein GXO99_00770 [Nitrospirae bacterium]|nr:hypothetical protein [Nitrospirota bacterium]